MLESMFWLCCVLSIVVGTYEGIQKRRQTADPRTPAQRRAMREDCRKKGL